ncbi:hypothetical protein PGUG_05343 [Meyerozyma guilliermondii ATCC 6260]|uniref:Iron transporter FTH1 n=1 Tax=Meyerozyma guilliermondii (strain ATCC 6260 / CBS 566 / DSM 6381 / JCM 1539 / NBRC 10279 / NRRL Y-324) TaxID=294746 RepID=A5DPZ2_PICGU|nr:uncharacterized protein PGUG_05343 [Meyerozyma guilliermondii ATCC 6260]EDK41245.2 hypothetical protein PGUG_05343 [Meyerozyma guilliermondii ATCC 6260]
MASLEDNFSIQVFLIVFRETLESAIIISVLLAFVHQSFSRHELDKKEVLPGSEASETLLAVREAAWEPESTSEQEEDDNKLRKQLTVQVWVGGLLGIICCLIIGSFILGVFYILGSDLWSVAEHYWEGTFSIVASIIISVMGIKLLRVSKMQKKWKHKLAQMLNNRGGMRRITQRDSSSTPAIANSEEPQGKVGRFSEKYSMLLLPFVTTLREGMEAIVFVGGIGINENTSIWAIVNGAIAAIALGSLIGIVLYRSGNTLPLRWFLISSTCLLYLVAAGLFSKGVWNFELQRFIDKCDGFDVSETGHGPGSYDIGQSVWHVNCCNGELQDDGPYWMMATAILGWTNSATYGSVSSYILYWVTIIAVFTSLTYEEKHGRLPLIPLSWQKKRILKRIRFMDHEILTVQENVRESIDSVNSRTPLQN